MALISLTGITTTVDESPGLQDDDTETALPTDLSTRLAELALGTPIQVAAGSDDAVSIDAAGFQGIAFTDSDGNPLDGVDSGLLTLDNEPILLFSDTGAGSDDNIVIGRTALGEVAFVVYAEETLENGDVTGAKLWIVEYTPLQHADADDHDDSASIIADSLFLAVESRLEFDFSGTPAGKSLLLTYGDPDTAQIIVTGQHFSFDDSSNGIAENQSEEVNSSKGGGDTTLGNENQLVNPGEGLLFTLVTGTPAGKVVGGADTLTNDEADDPNSIDFDAFFEARAASVNISQLQGGTATTVRITALHVEEAPGDVQGIDFFHDINDNDDTVLHIDPSSVQVLQAPGGTTTPTISVDANGVLTIEGIEANDTIEFALAGSETLDMTRIRVELPSDADAGFSTPFDVGGFALVQSAAERVDVGPQLHFDDDGPSIATTGTPPTLTVDETVLATDATASFAANFDAAFGADGAGSVTYALGISATGADSGLVDTESGNAVFLFLESGAVVGREGADSTDAQTGEVVFQLSVDGDGNVTLDQQRAVVHDDPEDPDEAATPATLGAASLVTLTATVTDRDGDDADATLEIGGLLNFEDDGPTIATTGTPPSLTVDETVLATDASASFAANFSSAFGADGAGTLGYALGLSSPMAESMLTDTATGNTVFLFLESGIVVGREGTDATDAQTGEVVFQLSVDGDGNLTLDQQRAVVHDDPDDPDEALSPAVLGAASLVTLTATIVDKDGDHAEATLGIGDRMAFRDDGPVAIQPDDAAVVNAAGQSATEQLDVALDANDPATVADSTGADGFGSISFAGTDGTQLFGAIAGGDPEALTSGGEAIFLFGFGTDTLVATTDPANADLGAQVFTIALDVATDTYTIDMLAALDNGASVSFDNFGSGKAGLRDWFVVKDPRSPGLNQDLLFTGGIPGVDAVNNDSDDFSVNNQWIDPTNPNGPGGEMVRLGFVTGADAAGDTSTLAGIASEDPDASTLPYYEGNAVGVRVMQIQGSPNNRVDIRVTAYDDEDGVIPTGSEPAVAADMTDDAPDPIVEAWVEDDAGVELLRDDANVADDDPLDLIVFNDDGSVTFRNLDDGNHVFVRTEDGFNYVTYQNAETAATGNDSFALGEIDIRFVESGDPIDTAFDLTLADGDGDTSSGSFNVTFNPDIVT